MAMLGRCLETQWRVWVLPCLPLWCGCSRASLCGVGGAQHRGGYPPPRGHEMVAPGGQGSLSSCPFRGQRGWVLSAGAVGDSATRHLSLPRILAGAAAKCSRFSGSTEGQNIILQIFRVQPKIGRHTRTRTITTCLRKESADTQTLGSITDKPWDRH